MTNVFSNLVATLVAVNLYTNQWTEPDGARYETIGKAYALAGHKDFDGITFAFSNLYSVPIVTNKYVWTLAPLGTNAPTMTAPPTPFVIRTNLLVTNATKAPVVILPIGGTVPLINNRGR